MNRNLILNFITDFGITVSIPVIIFFYFFLNRRRIIFLSQNGSRICRIQRAQCTKRGIQKIITKAQTTKRHSRVSCCLMAIIFDIILFCKRQSIFCERSCRLIRKLCFWLNITTIYSLKVTCKCTIGCKSCI